MFEKLRQKLIPKDENSKAFRRDMAKKISGKSIKYVTERINDEDIVIGHAGSLSLRDGKLIVMADGNVVFRSVVEQTRINELMSLDGVILTAPDLEHGGKERSVIAYYLYYRK